MEALAKTGNCKVSEVYDWKATEMLNWLEYILQKEAYKEQIK